MGSGFVMYETFVDVLPTDPALLSIQDLKDRAYVYVEKVTKEADFLKLY